MRDRIWGELCQVKTSEIYTELLADYYRTISTTSNILIDIFSAGGVIMGLSFWKSGTILPLISCIIIAIIQGMKKVMPKLIPSEKQFKNITQISKNYTEYHTKLEKFWYAYENNELNAVEARDVFYVMINERDAKIKKIESDTLPRENRRIQKKAQKEAAKYFSNNFKDN